MLSIFLPHADPASLTGRDAGSASLPVRGTGQEVFSLGPTWPAADQRAVLNLRPGPTRVGFWLLAPCCPNPFPCPDAQGLHRAEPPLLSRPL